MSDDQGHPSGGDAGTERALDELRVALEQLAGRMGAGFREDLAQIRAIAASVAERDLTGDVQALRADVAHLVGAVDQMSARLEQLPTSQQVTNLSGDLRAHLADALGDLDGDAVLREVGGLRAQLGVEHGTVVEQLQDNLADVASGEVVGALWDEVRTMRTELADGLVVEPSDALSAALDDLKLELDGLRGALVELRDAPEPAPPEPSDAGRDDDAVLQRLDALHSGIEDLRARLDEGLVLADDTELPAASTDGAGVEALADQVASLRDFVASELDTVRQTVGARIDAAAEATAATVAAATARPAAEPEPADERSAIETDAVELLRDEIRAAGAIPDQVIDALREELKALRRRIAVKASEQVLDDRQLAQIADAVAARLAGDREQA